jgi:hypothetical protein
MVVRAAQDRALDDGGLLFGKIDALPEAGRAHLDLPAKPGRSARQATLAVRFMRVNLKRPANSVDLGLAKSLSLRCISLVRQAWGLSAQATTQLSAMVSKRSARRLPTQRWMPKPNDM